MAQGISLGLGPGFPTPVPIPSLRLRLLTSLIIETNKDPYALRRLDIPGDLIDSLVDWLRLSDDDFCERALDEGIYPYLPFCGEKYRRRWIIRHGSNAKLKGTIRFGIRDIDANDIRDAIMFARWETVETMANLNPFSVAREAAYLGDGDLVNKLLQARANILLQPLIRNAARGGHIDLARELIERHSVHFDELVDLTREDAPLVSLLMESGYKPSIYDLIVLDDPTLLNAELEQGEGQDLTYVLYDILRVDARRNLQYFIEHFDIQNTLRDVFEIHVGDNDTPEVIDIDTVPPTIAIILPYLQASGSLVTIHALLQLAIKAGQRDYIELLNNALIAMNNKDWSGPLTEALRRYDSYLIPYYLDRDFHGEAVQKLSKSLREPYLAPLRDIIEQRSKSLLY